MRSFMATVNIMILDESLVIKSFSTEAYVTGRYIKFKDNALRNIENGDFFRYNDDNGGLCILYGNAGGLVYKFSPIRKAGDVDFSMLKKALKANPKATLKEALLMSKI